MVKRSRLTAQLQSVDGDDSLSDSVDPVMTTTNSRFQQMMQKLDEFHQKERRSRSLVSASDQNVDCDGSENTSIMSESSALSSNCSVGQRHKINRHAHPSVLTIFVVLSW
jgi:hypothetical protein